jgi:predicted kinase
LAAPRSLDRLDHRLAARRLRGKHVRAVGRALARRRGRGGGLSCAEVWVGKKRRVRFARAPARPGQGSGREDALALALDLRARGAEPLAEQLVFAYALAADDYAVLERLPAPERGAALVLAVGGLVASGKSTVAKYLARRIGAVRVVADRVRRALLERARDEPAHELTWQPAFGDAVYAGLLERAARVLASGRSVVIDACFPSRNRRRAAAALAARYGARFAFVHCDAPEEDRVARLRRRDVRDGGPPGAWEKLAHAVEERWEAPRPGEHVHLETSLPRKAWLRALGIAKVPA